MKFCCPVGLSSITQTDRHLLRLFYATHSKLLFKLIRKGGGDRLSPRNRFRIRLERVVDTDIERPLPASYLPVTAIYSLFGLDQRPNYIDSQSSPIKSIYPVWNQFTFFSEICMKSVTKCKWPVLHYCQCVRQKLHSMRMTVKSVGFFMLCLVRYSIFFLLEEMCCWNINWPDINCVFEFEGSSSGLEIEEKIFGSGLKHLKNYLWKGLRNWYFVSLLYSMVDCY